MTVEPLATPAAVVPPDHAAPVSVDGKKSHTLVARPSSMDAGALALRITFKNLSWTVDIPNTDPATKKAKPTVAKSVLKNVSGVFRPGKLTAVMGSSGAGKTTLLNVIAGYADGGRIEGDLLVNGEAIPASFMRELSGYVHQSDVILPTMKVREAVTMAAFLRLPKSMPDEEKYARVEEVLRWLNLVKVADNQIGSPEKKGISGGERRRVSVAMEMVRNPSILYLDEPTSGLDSFTAYAMTHLLRTVAHQHNRTIVATIHQPSSEIFALFDELVLLDQGQVIYHGPAQEVASYFSSYLGYHCPKFHNVADYMFMHILNGGDKKDVIGRVASAQVPDAAGALVVAAKKRVDEDSDSKENTDLESPDQASAMIPSKATTTTTAVVTSEQAREQAIIDTWNQPLTKTGEVNEYRAQLDRELESNSVGRKLPSREDMHLDAADFGTQFYFLCWRSLHDVLRNPYKLRARVGQALFMGLFCGLCYLQVGHSQESVQNRRGVLFFVSAGGIMNSTMGTIPIFAPEKAVFKREYASRMYGLTPFFLSRFFMELPLRIVMPWIMATIVYWMVGLQAHASNYFIFAGTLVLLDIVGTALGMCFATIFPSLPVALAASPMIMLPLMLFSGFFLNANSIPPYFEWFSYLSPIKYAFMILARNELAGLEFCKADVHDPACIYPTGEAVLDQLNLKQTLPEGEGILVALAVGLFLIAYFALWGTAKRL